MPPVNVVVAHTDPALLQSLAISSQKDFLNLATLCAASGVGEAVARHRAQLAVVDLELLTLSQLGELCREFPATAFVCTHRLADDAMWSQSLAAGAVDCCLASDLPRILGASQRYIAIKQAPAVSAA